MNDAIMHGIWTVAGIVYIATGSAIIIAAIIVKLSRRINEQPARDETAGVFGEGASPGPEALHAGWNTAL